MLNQPGIVLILQFNWPQTITKELGLKVHHFHDLIIAADWIEEKVPASKGIGGKYNSIWVLKMENYAALDHFLHGKNEIAENFTEWADQMLKMKINVKEEVQFL